MKNLVQITMMVALAMSVGCGQKRNSSVSSLSDDSVGGIQVTNGADSKLPITALDKDVAKMVLEYWNPTKIGQSYYMHVITTAILSGKTYTQNILYEYRNPKFVIRPNGLSEADKLNGIEWSGEVSLTSEAFRTYSKEKWGEGFINSNPPPPDKTWQEWKSGGGWQPLVFVRIKGKWQMIKQPSIGEGRQIFKQVDTSDLPK